MNNGFDWSKLVWLAIFLVLVLVDLGLNLLGFIPGIGPVVEGLSELLLEAMGVILFSIILFKE